MKIPIAISVVPCVLQERNLYRFGILFLLIMSLVLYVERSHNHNLAFVVNVHPPKPSKCRLIQHQNYIRPLKTRMELPSYFNELTFEVGAELGVLTGEYSKHILTNCHTCKTLYLVDTWAQEKNYKDFANTDDAEQGNRMLTAQRDLADFKNRTVFLKGRTDEMVKQIKDSSLDFIYLDARHDYCAVAKDLQDWWPKIRPGGLLTGHDFVDDKAVAPAQDWTLCEDGRIEPGSVERAVQEFAAEHNLVISVMYREPGANSYMMRKPLEDPIYTTSCE